MDRVRRLGRSIALLSAVIAAPTALAVPAFAEESFKLGIVTFLSGPSGPQRRAIRRRTAQQGRSARSLR